MEKKSEHKPLKIILEVLVFVIIIYFAYEYFHKYFYIFKDPKRIKALVLSYGKYSVGVFLGLQIIQVVIFFIPGEIVQIAGGYIYGTFWGSILSIVGILLGSAATYFISANLARKYVKNYFKKKHNFLTKILHKFASKYIVFFIYLIPGVPKDIVGYLCGISEIKFKDFIIYSTLGRIPGTFISAFFGYKMFSKDISTLIVVGIIMVIVSVLGVFKGESAIKRINKAITKHKHRTKN